MKEYKYKIAGKDYKVVINKVEDFVAEVEVNGETYQVEMEKVEKAAPVIVRPVVAAAAPVASAPKAAAGAAGAIKSPLPGIILEINVNVGDVVKVGQKVAMLEAMKMENAINADHEGKVVSINVNKGDSVLEGTDLIVLE
ncbi:MAG: biotin/lipoyl-containing protein [Bacteroidota bacterium]|nr:biotin/lipoyl-containing protein [Bacteroidota bacterium]